MSELVGLTRLRGARSHRLREVDSEAPVETDRERSVPAPARYRGPLSEYRQVLLLLLRRAGAA